MDKETLEGIRERLQLDGPHKKTALIELEKYCKDLELSTDLIAKIYDELYLHVLKCYSDRYESVRNQAASTITEFTKRMLKTDFHLLNVIATLCERMGKEETLEKCEELRLVYIEQLHFLIDYYDEQSLQESYASIITILSKGIRDPFSHVQRESCICVVTLSKKATTSMFQPYAEKLAKPLFCMLNHKHSLSRIAAVSALSRLTLHINANTDLLPKLIMEVSPLLMDSMPLVRRECGDMGILLLLELQDRYSYFDRVIPLVLCCLKDDSPDVVNYIRPKWVKCGQLYYEENEAELNKQELADIFPPNYPQNVDRPTIGCRALVQRSLRLLQLITRESGDWKENVRLHSLRLLYQFILHAEAAMTAKFFEIYPDLARACRDADTTVANEAFKVADLMGRLLTYEDWCVHGFDGLAKNAHDGYLKCFYYMFTSSVGVRYLDLVKIADILEKPEFSQTLKPGFQWYVIKLIETIIDKLKEISLEGREDSKSKVDYNNADNSSQLSKGIYVSTIKVMALSKNTEKSKRDELQEKGVNILESIAAFENLTLDQLHAQYFHLALDYVVDLDALLDASTEPILLLDGLISIGQFRPSYMKKLQIKIKEVFENCADDAKVRIFSVISIVALSWDESVGKEVEVTESSAILEDFLKEIVEPNLGWRAGANAEAMRSLATATVCSISQGARNEAEIVLPKLAKYMPSLLEDHAVATRNYAIKCLFNFGELKVADLRNIAYAALQRLDDPSSGIRELAVRVIPALRPIFDEEFTREIWDAFIKKAIEMFLLHYEGPDLRIRNVIKDSLNILSKAYPELYKQTFSGALVTSLSSKTLRELQNEIDSY